MSDVLLKNILESADAFFSKYPAGISYAEFKIFMTEIEMLPEDEAESKELFNIIDSNKVFFL